MVARIDGKIVRLGVDKKVPLQESWIDKNLELDIELSTFGDSMDPTIRVIGVGK